MHCDESMRSLLLRSLELKSRKENFNRTMPDLEIDMHSNPFGDQDDPDNNFDQISVGVSHSSASVSSHSSLVFDRS